MSIRIEILLPRRKVYKFFYFKFQPDDGPIGSKNATEWILYRVVLDGYSFMPSLINIPLQSIRTIFAANF